MEAWHCLRAEILPSSVGPYLGRGCSPRFRQSPVVAKADLALTPVHGRDAKWWRALEARPFEKLKALNDGNLTRVRQIGLWIATLQVPETENSITAISLNRMACQMDLLDFDAKTKAQIFAMFEEAKDQAEATKQE
jgi:hypothetical protein